MSVFSGYIPELIMGLSSLMAHKMRSLLTMLGMIFGVGAVVAMMSITAGAQSEMMSIIDLLGVDNIIVEAQEAVDRDQLQARRAVSPGLTFRDYRALSENVGGIEDMTPRKRFEPSSLLPTPSGSEMPQLIGVEPQFLGINSLSLGEGRFFSDQENEESAQVAVLGETAKVSLLGYGDAVGEWVKINDVWLQVVGVLAQQASADTEEDLEVGNANNLIIAPLNTVMRRFEDTNSYLKDEIDGIYMKVTSGTDSIETASVVSAILNASHKGAGDFKVTVPAGLLEQRRRTQAIFDIVMTCIAAISLLVGGIGIMNIMLATVLERTREIGIRRAIGARQADIIRQFLTEAVLISILGGLIGIAFGFTLSRIIALSAGWSTVVTGTSIAVAFGVSVGIGLLFGIYPAMQAAKLDPIEAIRYE